MDGYTLMSKMRKLRRRFRFTATEQALFYELMAVCNDEDWRNVFECSNIELCGSLNINEKTLIKARESLINANLIYYKSGKSRRTISEYSFEKPFKTAEKTTKRSTVNNTVDKGVNNTVDKGINSTDSYKLKLKHSLSLTREEIPKDIFEKSLDDCYVELRDDRQWMETVCMNTRSAGNKAFTTEVFYSKLEEFFMKLQNEGDYRKSPKDAKRHFASWLRIELEKQKNNGNSRSSYTSKQEANDYAMQQYIAERKSWEQGVPGEVSKPF